MKNSAIFIIFFSVLVSITLSPIPALSSENDKLQTYQVHTVKAGDSLSKIAKEYYDDHNKAALIASFNRIKDINRLNIGQKIKIPVLPMDPSKKASTVSEVDLGAPGQGGGGPLEEKSLNKWPAGSQLDGGAVFFVIIYLLVMLSLLLIRWIGLQDDDHAEEPEENVGFFRRHKWRP